MAKATGINTKILEALKDIGPMTAEELCQFLGLDNPKQVSDSIVGLRKKTPRKVYVAEYQTAPRGVRIAVWGYGTRPDAPVIKKTKKDLLAARRARYAELNRLYRLSSPFRMAATWKEMRDGVVR